MDVYITCSDLQSDEGLSETCSQLLQLVKWTHLTLSPVIGRQSPFNEEIFVIVTVLQRHEWLCPTETVQLYCEAVTDFSFVSSETS